MANQVKGGVLGNIAKLRSAIKKGGGSGYLTRVPAEGDLQVRFLTEPDEWAVYWEHYDSDKKFFPCSEDCDACDAGGESAKKSQRYLANALDVGSGKVIPLVLPKTVVTPLVKYYDRYKTIIDRDYVLERTGSGTDTTYSVIMEAPKRLRLEKYELLDLDELLGQQLKNAMGDDEDDDEDDAPPRRSSKKSAPARTASRRSTIDDDDDDDDAPRRPLRRPGAARRVQEAPQRAAKRTIQAPAKKLARRK